MDTLEAAATHVVAGPSPSLDVGAVAAAPPDEPQVGRWPGWLRLMIVIGGGAALWAGIAWAVVALPKLG